MKKHTLTGTNRTVIGKKVAVLRKQGQIPATLYGKHKKSESVTVSLDAFASLYKEAGEAGLVELAIDGKVHPVLIHDVQIHPVTGEYLHIEFHEVDLKEKVQAKVSVEHKGESPAVIQKLGVFLVIHDAVEVEALPAELPEKLTVDISTLQELNQEILASQISLPHGVTLVTDPTTILMKIGPLVTKEAEVEATKEAAAAAETAMKAESMEQPEQASASSAPSSEKATEEKK